MKKLIKYAVSKLREMQPLLMITLLYCIPLGMKANLQVDDDGSFLIASASDWKEFAAIAETKPQANAKLVNDIDLGDEQTMIGIVVPFQGNFDGQGHTLNVAFCTNQSGAAPFRNVSGATIERLHVTGTIESTYVGVGGVAANIRGEAQTTIRDCWSSALLTSGTGGIGNTIGGIVADNSKKSTLVIEDCLFDGRFADKNYIFNAGIVANNWGMLIIRNTLNIGTYQPQSTDYSGTFYRPDTNNHAELDNVYYLNACGETQGKQVTIEQLADGTVVEWLQNGRTDRHWKQLATVPTLTFAGTLSMEPIDAEEWLLLQMAYQAMGNGEGWKHPWNFSSNSMLACDVPGIEAKDGHIKKISLQNNEIEGSFPFVLLNLPYMEKLNLSNNHLSGDLGLSSYVFMQQNPNYVVNLRELNISGNQFSGNIGLFANCFTNLTSLDASGNCLEDVYPVIPSTVTTLDISKQTIARVVPLHLANLSVDSIATKVPSILLYDHANQTFTPNINLLCTTPDNTWGMTMAYQNGALSIPYVSEQNTYYGESGDTLNVAVLNNNGSREGSTFRINLSFDEGDGNFDGKVNILDLQTTLNYMFEEYANKPYNFTASNLWKDEIINVQDAVCFVNILLDANAASARQLNASRRVSAQPSEASASVTIENGYLTIRSAVPVSAFDIMVSTDQQAEVLSALNYMGFTYTSKQSGNNLHLVGYSLNGAEIPAGETAICKLNSGTVSYVMLSDREANEISISMNGSSTTSVQSSLFNTSSREVYRIPLGAKRAIIIDTTGRKALIKDEK